MKQVTRYKISMLVDFGLAGFNIIGGLLPPFVLLNFANFGMAVVMLVLAFRDYDKMKEAQYLEAIKGPNDD